MKSAAIIASYPYYHYDRLGRIDCEFSQRGGAGAEHLIASYKYYPTGSVKTVTLGNSLSLTYTYHISGVVKSAKVVSANGGEYSYYGGTNKLKSVADNMGGSTSYRTMSANDNFAYDRDGNLVEDKSKQMKIAYNWRGMPIEFVRKTDSGDSLKLVMKYDGSGNRISKTSMRKVAGEWDTLKVTHYTGIGTEIREEYADSAAGTKVVVPMPQGLGRYKVADASVPADDNASRTFEWYLKNHLGSTMLVYGTVASTDPNNADIGETKAAYDYRAFGEMVELVPHDLAKVTENFTGKELDDEIALDYFGARYLDPMLGMWTSVDPKRQFASPYLYAGNGYNPVNVIDPDGNEMIGYLAYLNEQAMKAEPQYWGSKVLKYEFERMSASPKIYRGKAGDYSYYRIYGQKQESQHPDVDYEVFIHTPGRTLFQQACTAVHEYLEEGADMRDGTMVQYIPENWHWDPTMGLDQMQDYYKEKAGGNAAAGFDAFLKANYEGSLTDGIKNYPSDNVYKREYECLNDK